MHDTLSGPATKCLLEHAFTAFGDRHYERPASISIVHLYNLLQFANTGKAYATRTNRRVVAATIEVL
jgi:hypothetical protein